MIRPVEERRDPSAEARGEDDGRLADGQVAVDRDAYCVSNAGGETPPAGEEFQPPGPASPAHALMWGLRRRADEAQLTQAIAAIARVDRRFGARFVALVLDAAADGTLADNVRAFRAGGLPDELDCRAEESLGEEGRVDLRFDGGDLTLFMENKLYSGYGHEQVQRYLRSVRRLPRGTRSALVAVTRAVPTYGEPKLDEDERWLGSVRWAHLLSGMRSLPIADTQLASQWQLLLDVLDKQGDLGMTRADADLIRAWARYQDGRSHLSDLLDQIWPRALDIVHAEMTAKYGRKGSPEELADVERRGKQGKVIQRDQNRVFLGFCIPASVKYSPVKAQFSGVYGVPHFTVQVEPLDAQTRLDAADRQLAAADNELGELGFKSNRRYWARVHEPDEYLDADDVPKRLLELLATDVRLIVTSGILDHDLQHGLTNADERPRRRRRLLDRL